MGSWLIDMEVVRLGSRDVPLQDSSLNWRIFFFRFGVFCFSRYMGIGNFTGVPGMTLPVGYDDQGLPIALQIMSSWWNEHTMLRVAHAAEGFVTKKKPQVHYSLLEWLTPTMPTFQLFLSKHWPVREPFVQRNEGPPYPLKYSVT